MKPASRLGRVGMAAALLTACTGALATPSNAQTPRVCVYDLLGASGDVYNMAKDFALEAPRLGTAVTLRAYTDERVATQDFITGQCDAVFATGFRTRQFNSVTSAIDSLGSTSIVKNNKLDMDAAYQVVKTVIATFASPNASKFVVRGDFEVAGIIPFGTAYPVVNDRNIRTVEALAGKRIASFDYDKAQATMIQKIGAQPVSADITNFATKFNNGSVDMIAAPAMAYKPLELYRGIGSKGAINRFPILILSYQMIINRNKFPEGFGAKSRQFWLGQFERAQGLIVKAEKEIPASAWGDLTPENMIKYTVMLRESRIAIAEQGIYDKTGLKIIKRSRCKVNPADPECSTDSESWQ